MRKTGWVRKTGPAPWTTDSSSCNDSSLERSSCDCALGTPSGSVFMASRHSERNTRYASICCTDVKLPEPDDLLIILKKERFTKQGKKISVAVSKCGTGPAIKCSTLNLWLKRAVGWRGQQLEHVWLQLG